MDSLHKAADGSAVDLDQPLADQNRKKLAVAIAEALREAADDVATQVEAGVEVDRLTMVALGNIADEIEAGLGAAAVESSDAAIADYGLSVSTDLVNEHAIKWAEERAAALITSSGTGGTLLDTTRDAIREMIADAVRDGTSMRDLAKQLRESFAFGKDRAQMIAHTEIAAASVNGAMQAWIVSGVVKRKRWILAEGACTVCQANADQGEIDLLQEFASGDMGPPGHPRCRCSVIGITKDETMKQVMFA
ncbi:MAG: hypothetical protein JSR70_07575 [Proteobacteria bacterium]|nr:hypothetical protein [Pseudomonadota bacterium]